MLLMPTYLIVYIQRTRKTHIIIEVYVVYNTSVSFNAENLEMLF